MAVNVRKSLAVDKQTAQKFDVEGFNLWKLYELEVRKQYQIRISNRFAALENLRENKGINRARENKQNIETTARESFTSVWIEAAKIMF